LPGNTPEDSARTGGAYRVRGSNKKSSGTRDSPTDRSMAAIR
jgi:hypothetical protein